MIEDALYTAASTHAGLTALIGSGLRCRFYPVGEIPDGVSEPYVTYQRVSGIREHAMVQDPGLAHPRFQLTAWGSSYGSVKDVAAQVRACFQDWSGTVSGVVIQRSFIDNEVDLTDIETGTAGIALDFIIWHLE